MDDILDILDTSEGRGFVLWHGVVDDIYDPLKLGRVRVRIIGWHNLDPIKMPFWTLPWAPVVKSPTGSTQSSNLTFGDWVTGFFLDGTNAQKPIVMGKYDGISLPKAGELSGVSQIPDANSYFKYGAGYPIDLTDEQKKMLRSYPKPALNINTKVSDRPTTPLLAQGIVSGTAVDIANKNRAHVCDISKEMRNAAAVARVAFGALMQGIRAAIRAVLAALGFNPESESARFIELAKEILRGIKFVQSIIDEIRDYTQVFINYARQIRAMIDWILSLPKALAALLAGCLNELLNAVGSAFSTLVGGAAGVNITESIQVVTDIIDSGKKVINDSVNLITVPAQIVDALSTPSTAESQNAALNTIVSFTSTFSKSNNSISNVSRP